MPIKKILFLLITLLTFKNGYSQDPVFSQYFMIPETINTGFTGALETPKFGVVHRTQWADLDFSINTQFAYVDGWFDNINSGIGVSILNHTETNTKYKFTQVNLDYALAIRLSREWYLRPSISVGLGIKDYAFQNLLLEDQVNISTGTINSSSIDPTLLLEKKRFVDFSSSLLLNNENSWFGLTIRHLNKPNISLTSEGNTPLDMFISVHSVIEFPLYRYSNYKYSDKNSVYFLSNFMMQGDFSRLDIGSQYVYDDTFSFGILAVTNPLKNNSSKQFLTSINAFVGLKWKDLKFGYSYDLNISKIGNTGGVYEFSISYSLRDYVTHAKCPVQF